MIHKRLGISEALYTDIERAASESGSSPGDILSKALVLFFWAKEQKNKGLHVGSAESADLLTQEVVGL